MSCSRLIHDPWLRVINECGVRTCLQLRVSSYSTTYISLIRKRRYSNIVLLSNSGLVIRNVEQVCTLVM